MGLARAFFDLKRWDDAIALTGNMLESDPRVHPIVDSASQRVHRPRKALKAAENF